MKKLALMMLLICGSAFAENTYTTNAGIPKPADSDTGWGETIRDAFDIIDSSFATLSGNQTFTGSPTISSATITTLRSDRILVATPTYTGSTDEFAVKGEVRSGGSIYACDSNFQNCSSLDGLGTLTLDSSIAGAVYIVNDGTVQGGVQLKASTVQGSSSINLSNLPAVFSADRLMIGSTFGDRVSNTVDASASRSAFETPVYIGTHTVSGTPKLAVLGDTSSSFSVLIGTSPTLSSTNYHVSVATTGAFGLQSRTAAEIVATKPNRVGESFYCSNCATVAVCVSTGTAVNQWALITNKGSACN